MVEEGDEVELTKDRVGIIRYKGPLDCKNGVFYGVELTQGQGKHSGLFKGKRYFMCQKLKGVFVDKKQILYKLEPTITQPAEKKKKKGSRNSVARKGSDASGKKKKKKKDKGGWKPPSWTQEVLDDDTGFLDDRRAHRGKQIDRKSLYQKAGYLPHAKWRKKKYTPSQWAGTAYCIYTHCPLNPQNRTAVLLINSVSHYINISVFGMLTCCVLTR